ncbi:THO complex subunit 1 [Hordeum vulgare]|nr:THO complex subunit 1 [Hordeum vulgare]
MAKPSPPPPPNSGLRILLAKDRTATSSPSAPAVVSSHADRDRIIGVFRTALSRNKAPEAFALQAVQEAIKPQKQTVLVLGENQTMENALQRLLRELLAEKDEKMRLRNGEGREGQDRQVVHRAEEVRDRRWALLLDVRDKLLFEQYAGSTRAKVPPRSSLHIPWSWLPAALCVLQEEEFEEYTEKAKTLLDTTTNESKLCLYSLYKQATVGPVNTGIFKFYAPFLSFPYY